MSFASLDPVSMGSTDTETVQRFTEIMIRGFLASDLAPNQVHFRREEAPGKGERPYSAG